MALRRRTSLRPIQLTSDVTMSSSSVCCSNSGRPVDATVNTRQPRVPVAAAVRVWNTSQRAVPSLTLFRRRPNEDQQQYVLDQHSAKVKG